MRKLTAAIPAILVGILFVCFPANAGHVAACLGSAVPNELRGCPVRTDITYAHLSAGSFSLCARRVSISSTDPSTTLLVPAPSPFGLTGILEDPNGSLVANRADTILSRVVTLRRDLDKKAAVALREAVDNVALIAAYSVSANISGPIVVTLKGRPNSGGVLNATIGGVSLDARAKVRVGVVPSFILGGTVRGYASNLLFSVDYNVNTGTVTQLDTQSHIAVTADPTLLSFIPIAVLTNFYEERQENRINESINNNRWAIFSLDENIPNGVFVHNDIDYGAKVKRQLADFVEDIDVSVTQEGKSVSDVYVNIRVSNIELTIGRRITQDNPAPLLPSESSSFCGT